MQTKLSDGSVMVCGIVGKDAKTKRVGEKNSVLTNFSVKAGERTDQNGEKKAIWVNCTAWNDMGKVASTLKKGDTALVIGSVRKYSYTGNDGAEKTGIELVCEFVSGVFKSLLPEIPDGTMPESSQGDYVSSDYADLPF